MKSTSSDVQIEDVDFMTGKKAQPVLLINILFVE